jgi:putative membrane protein
MAFSNAESMHKTPFRQNLWQQGFLLLFVGVWISTLIGTSDLNNWLLENTLPIVFMLLLIITNKRFQFSDLSCLLLCLYLCLHVYGSKYTYAENPFGFWLQEQLHTSRNHYDRIVHFSFGFVLAYPMRELFINCWQLPKRLSWIIPIEITISISGMYELIEWAVADVFFKAQGVAYLGIQGDVWDAQKDMFVAFLGAFIGSSIISLIQHRRQSIKEFLV